MRLDIFKSKLKNLQKTIKLYPIVLFSIFVATIFAIIGIWNIEVGAFNSTLTADLLISSLYFAMSYMIVKLIITDKNIEITKGKKSFGIYNCFSDYGISMLFANNKGR